MNRARALGTWGAAVGIVVLGVTLQVRAAEATQGAPSKQAQPAIRVAPPSQAQPAKPAAAPRPTPVAPPAIPAGVSTQPDYVIGPDDVLSIVYWREKDMTADVTVRPDGKISLPLLNDIVAAGLTPEQLRGRLGQESRQYLEDPNVSVVVRQINSRKVFITGEVANPGPYPLSGAMTVLQLISVAGGLREYADGKKIVIVRNENGQPVSYPFNYKDVARRKNLRQNIELKPGDTVVVP